MKELHVVGVLNGALVFSNCEASDLKAIRQSFSEQTVTLRVPLDAWSLLLETLEVDAESSAFDPELRQQIRDALNSIEEIDET